MEKIQTVEDFYYHGEKIEKGANLLVTDIKKGFCRSGILVEVEFFLEKESKKVKDWIDVGMIYPMHDHFVLPRGTNQDSIKDLRAEKIKSEDQQLYSTWERMIEEGESKKVIRSIVTRLTSEKFGI